MKKIVASILALACAASLTTAAFAEELPDYVLTPDHAQDTTEVIFVAEETFEIEIPPMLDVNADLASGKTDPTIVVWADHVLLGEDRLLELRVESANNYALVNEAAEKVDYLKGGIPYSIESRVYSQLDSDNPSHSSRWIDVSTVDGLVGVADFGFNGGTWTLGFRGLSDLEPGQSTGYWVAGEYKDTLTFTAQIVDDVNG